MKKGVIITLIIFSLMLVGAVSAQKVQDLPGRIGSFIDDATKTIEPIASTLLGETPKGELLFAKVLFFIIVLAIIWVALERIEFFSTYPFVLWAISIAAAILAVRFLSDQNWIRSILLPYETLGIAISAGLPFVIYFIIVNVGMQGPANKTFRRIAWIFFCVIFVGLWLTRDLEDGGWIYPITALLSLIMIFFDGTIQRFFRQILIEKTGAQSRQEAEITIREKLHNLDDLLAKGVITPQERASLEKRYKRQLKALLK